MPQLKLSDIGRKMNRLTGVREIMKDIAQTIKSDPNKHWLNLSPGNPLILPELESMWRSYATEILGSNEFGSIIGRYGMTQGYEPFIEAIVSAYNHHYNWGIENKNVLVTAGSQSLYFYCANLFAGPRRESDQMLKILIPLCPEYTGYDGVVLYEQAIVGVMPQIEIVGHHEFKYKVDFDQLHVDDSIGAIVCSRPCNPTGNVITDEEVRKLLAIAKSRDIPLIIDSAYAPPFPNLAFTPMEPMYDEHIIHCVSLSKAGLPGERIGYAIGHEKYIQAIEPFESNAGIHSSRFGQALAARAFISGQLAVVSEAVVKPFYLAKLELFRNALREHMPDGLPWYTHRVEGALFSWLWVDHDKMHDLEMYKNLKAEGLIAVPGSSFFPGLPGEWKHKHQCMRFSMTASDQDIEAAAVAMGRAFSRL